jgi:hypothetical protein
VAVYECVRKEEACEEPRPAAQHTLRSTHSQYGRKGVYEILCLETVKFSSWECAEDGTKVDRLRSHVLRTQTSGR